MRSILPDDETVSTKLDVMRTAGALIRFMFLLIGLFLSIIFSFAPPNTVTRTMQLKTTIYQSSYLTDPVRIQNLDSLSSFLIINLQPFIIIEKEGEYDFQINTTIHQQLLDGSTQYDGIKYQNYSTKCNSEGCDPIRVYEANFIEFNSITIAFSIKSDFPTFNPTFTLKYVTESSFIAITAFVVITIMTFLVALVLFFIVPRRLKPTRGDHWATFYLGLFIFLVDGPWLILKYYTPKVSSQIFDLAPEIFHIAFFLTMTFFVSARTVELPHVIFSSWVVRFVISSLLFIIIVTQFVVTKLMPLCTLSVYIKESSLEYPIYAVSAVTHLIILGLLIFGVLSLQIERVFVVVLSAFSFTILEVIYIARLCIRFWIPFQALGISFAADVFYILMANIITIFFLCVNLPFKKTLQADEDASSREIPLTDTEREVTSVF
ncbi:hypothetical protein TRFO_02841 [Tritrichomonas foetus]|uniref:Transmembrane protein n=1 Tax=Tritrichomonas foetus TaxID=1144522 RepID=A0A1J4KXA8_9EUKA|nr:hypothetical protein TRFO_02841 [Tritrichomonas foetus]|eukprot:OHT15520.1 hypothetical protein TRFO_02841 [Tritrichomonas foetus]